MISSPRFIPFEQNNSLETTLNNTSSNAGVKLGVVGSSHNTIDTQFCCII
jgi:hypothetical protein